MNIIIHRGAQEIGAIREAIVYYHENGGFAFYGW